MPPNWEGRRINAFLRISTHIGCGEPLTISIGSLRFSRAAGYLPASRFPQIRCPICSYKFSYGPRSERQPLAGENWCQFDLGRNWYVRFKKTGVSSIYRGKLVLVRFKRR